MTAATPFWASKTIWVNVLAFLATLVAQKTGFSLDAVDQGAILGIVNIGLRALTKQPLSVS